MTSRRDAIKTVGLGALFLSAPSNASTTEKQSASIKPATWATGVEGQRKADIGDGTYLNPIMAGDHPDPSIIKDGENYYMTFSTFEAYPGLIIWHSRDLVNWTPVTTALKTNIGSVWAPALCLHKSRYYIYIPTKKTSAPGSKTTSWVIWADRITGPWSEPVDLDLPDHIDPGHAVGEDGSRWLFLSGGDRVRLTDDGLSTVGKPEHVYDPWHYPEEWDVEGFSPEGPKVIRHGKYFYMVLAVGGTAGPPTGHMVIAARAQSIHGPWENHPRNPLVRTTSVEEKWWSRGHATLIEGPAGDWWSVYHGFENSYWTLGRQTLLAPIIWTKDGWLEFGGGDLSKPIRKPEGGVAGPHGLALSDDFRLDKYGIQWNFFSPGPQESERIKRDNGILHLKATGQSPATTSPLVFVAGEQDYEFECEIEVDPDTKGGLLLFYDHQLYCGLGFDGQSFIMHKYGLEHSRSENPYGPRMFMRVRNMRHIVRIHTSIDGQTWKKFERGMEVSGYHHNVRGGFLCLKPGLYAAGTGEVRFKNFKYQAFSS